MSDGRNTTLETTPHFIIIGAQKAGTSSLYNIIDQHPNIRKALNFETHFFDNRVPARQLLRNMTENELCDVRHHYRTFFPKTPPNTNLTVLMFEKTPSYLTFPEIPAAIAKLCFWKPKIVVILRNPIDRAFSQYKMNFERRRNKQTAHPSFETLVQREVSQWRERGHTSASLLEAYRDGAYHESEFRRRMDLPQTSRNDGRLAREGLFRGLYAQQLQNWLEHFELDKDLKVFQYERYKVDPNGVLNEIFRFVGAPLYHLNESLLTKDYSRVRKIETVDMKLSNVTRAYLEQLYRPYNDELADLLGEEWRNIWGY